MTDPGSPLQGLSERIPSVAAVTSPTISPAPTGPAAWLRAWSGRHTVASSVLAPVLFLAYRSAAGPTVAGDPAWTVLLALTALVGAGALATYLPQKRGAVRAMGSPCATLAGAHVCRHRRRHVLQVLLPLGGGDGDRLRVGCRLRLARGGPAGPAGRQCDGRERGQARTQAQEGWRADKRSVVHEEFLFA
jgi:hypothetical protein